MYNKNIMRYIPRKLNIKLREYNHTFCNHKLQPDSLGRKQRDKLAVNSITLDEICKFCDWDESLEKQTAKVKTL